MLWILWSLPTSSHSFWNMWAFWDFFEIVCFGKNTVQHWTKGAMTSKYLFLDSNQSETLFPPGKSDWMNTKKNVCLCENHRWFHFLKTVMSAVFVQFNHPSSKLTIFTTNNHWISYSPPIFRQTIEINKATKKYLGTELGNKWPSSATRDLRASSSNELKLGETLFWYVV